MLVDGAFVPSLSDVGNLDKGLSIRSLASAIGEPDVLKAISAPVNDPLAALNAALMSDGVVIDVAAGSAIERPIQIVHVSTTTAAMVTRSLVRIGDGAQVTLVESFAAPRAPIRSTTR